MNGHDPGPGMFLLGVGVVLVLLGLGAWFAGWVHVRSSPSSPSERFAVVSPDPELIRAGGRLYRRHCAVCHGKDGRGKGPSARFMDPPPLNFHSKRVRNLTDRELFRMISKGKLETGMPAWEGILTKKERRAVIAYLKSEFIVAGSDIPDTAARSASR